MTKAQRAALKRVFDRTALVIQPDGTTRTAVQNEQYYGLARYATYRQFRQTVQPGPGCVMVPWCNMWLGIEPDGYTHT
jgi:hypothetical protein